MLTRRKPMSRGTKGLARTAFVYKTRSMGTSWSQTYTIAETRDLLLQARAARAMAEAQATADLVLVKGVLAECASRACAMPKENPLRSERYRRVVAGLPCAWCGIEGFSQHAHENDGKGARMKVDDRRAMPLCCARPGVEGCHAAFDQYRLVPGGRQAHIDLGHALAEKTRATINALGLWPAGLPQFPGEA